MSTVALLVMTAAIIIEAMAIVALAAYYAGREAKIAPLLAEYERIKEELDARDEGIRDRIEKAP